ncbi:MAG: trypsin-like serine protease [Proteobacteria bacterium]|nr:trypsin-like serine protease [Pseudomonadota bacterium]
MILFLLNPMKSCYYALITLGFLLGTSCKHSNNSSDLTSPSTYGGKEYKSFVDLPPYFVELLFITPTSEFGACSAAHIGDGYILTATHCLGIFLCSHKKSDAKALGIRYNSRTSSGELQEQRLTYDQIEAVVMHKHYFVHPDSHIAPFIDATYAARAPIHDIALIKVQTDPQAPFAGKAILPTADQAALYSPQHVRGVVYQHGIGKEFSPEYREYKKWKLAKEIKDKSKDIPPFKGNTLISRSFFGGAVQVVASDSQILKDLVKRYQEREEVNYQIIIKKLQSLRDPHKRLAVTESIARKRTEATKMSCFQHYTEDGEAPFSSNLLFSQDGLTAQEPYFSQPMALFRKFQLSIDSNSSNNKFSREEVATYAKKIAKAITDLTRYRIQEEIGRKWFIMTTLRPEDDPNKVLKTCYGDSGGPLVKHIEKQYIHLGVAVVFELQGGLMSSIPAGQKDRLRTLEEKEFFYKVTNCAQETHFASTFAHLDWIAAAKASIEAGNHSYQEHVRAIR